MKAQTKHISRNYYFLKKVHVFRFFLASSGLFGVYLSNRKFRYLNTFYDEHVKMPLDEMVNSEEVKGAALNLIEDLFKEKRTIKSITENLKVTIKDNEFEESMKTFIKQWLVKTFKDKEFLLNTKSELLKILNSKKVNSDTIKLLVKISDEEIAKDQIAEFFKNLFTSDEVLNPLSDLFQIGALNALDTDTVKNKAQSFAEEVFSDQDLKNFLYKQSLDVFSMYSGEKKYFHFDDGIKEVSNEVTKVINDL
jgi:hypothetical protein